VAALSELERAGSLPALVLQTTPATPRRRDDATARRDRAAGPGRHGATARARAAARGPGRDAARRTPAASVLDEQERGRLSAGPGGR